MTPQRWIKVKELLHLALEQEPGKRGVFLDSACIEDPSLKAEVVSLLVFNSRVDQFLDSPVIDLAELVKNESANFHQDNEGTQQVVGEHFVGRTLGDFIIREKLGEGGFGVVYRAEQLTLGREAVIKILRTKHRSSEQLIKRFKQEAHLASRLEHPYTAHIYAFGAEPDGLMWIAMEYVRGTPLDKLLETQGPLPLERFVPLLDKICEVVATAHDNGIIHRDLKPANVMVIARAGRLLPKLLDFGIAKGLVAESALKDGIKTDLSSTPDMDMTVGLDSAANKQLAEETVAAAVMSEDRRPEKQKLSSQIETSGAIGSPNYMSPEQWENTATADLRTDIYALGVLTYEALTGRLPFRNYHEHITQPAPPLGSSFPAALDKVMSKALAKKVEDRYSTAIEYAAAFREAAGYSEQRAILPQMEEELRESLLANGPQPLAQAIANLGAARNAHQARGEIVEIFRVVVRYIGLLALACRARIGAGGKADAEEVIDSLRKLRRHRLSEEEWLVLARELCRPFAFRRDAYPIPELVSLFFEQGSDSPNREARLFESFIQVQEAIAQGASQTEEQVSEAVAGRLPELERLLRALSFLRDYRLAVPRQDHTELWMGAIRGRIEVMFSGGKQLEEGKPLLIDAAGLAILFLWPIVQAAEPVPGTQEELFLLEGKGRQGAKLVSMPSGFERQDEEPWEWFRENFFDVGEGTEVLAEQERALYPGLVAYTAVDSDIFFGRERETETFLNRLKVQPLLAVVGASGAGKSSFVQAGVIPGLPEGWRTITVRPGSTPIATLMAGLAKEGIEVGDLREALEQNANALGVALRVATKTSSSSLALIVDQFEELFTLCLDAKERQLYAEGLARAARSAEDPVRIILTLRDDFLMRTKEMPGLSDRLTQGLELLTTPSSEDLIRIITEPARRTNYDFEDRNLPREIVDAVTGRPGALPLLAFTTARLWENRDRQFKQLRRKTYEAMGGVGGALAQHAEAIMAEMTQEEQRLVREAFRHLVTGEGTRAVLTRHELIQVLGKGSQAESVLEKLVTARLLTASEGEGGIERVEIVHEALLEAWPRLVKWRQEDAEGARLRDQLRIAARQWEERGRTKGMLWRDDALTEYQLWRSRYPGQVTEVEEAFGAASLTVAVRSRRIKRFAAIIAFSILAFGSITLFLINRQIKSNLLDSYEEQGQQELLKGNALRASVYLSEVYRQGRDNPSLRLLLAQSMRPVEAQLFSIKGHTNILYSASFSSDGKHILTGSADGTAKVWDAAGGKLLVSLNGHAGEVWSAAFSPDGNQIVTASFDKTAKVWDVATGKLLVSLEGHTERLISAAFSPDGKRIVTACVDGTAKVWDTESSKLLMSLEGHKDQIRSAVFSPDGKQILTASFDKTAKVWDAATGKLLVSLEGYTDRLCSAAFSSDGKQILIAGFDKTAKVWDAATGKLLVSLEGHKERVHYAAFSPDNKQIATASLDKTAKVWDASTGKLLFTLEGHTNSLWTAAFSPDGKQIVTASKDNTAKVWDVATSKLFVSLEGHRERVVSAAFSPDGKQIVTASEDKTAEVRDAESGKLLVSLEGHKQRLISAAFSPDGKQIVTASKDNTAKVWDAASGKLLFSLEGHTDEVIAAFSPDGKCIVTASVDKTVKVWDAASGKLLLALEGYTNSVLTAIAAFSPDCKRIVTASVNRTAKVWDVASGKLIVTLEGHTDELFFAAFSPDCKRIVTASVDRTAKVWDVASGKLIVTLEGHARLIRVAVFSPDGKQILTGGADGAAKVWNASTGKLLYSLEGHTNWVNYSGFSPDGKRIVTGSADNTAKVWDAASGKLLITLEGHTDALTSVAFSPDGKRILTASWDKTAKVWDVHLETRSPGEIAEIVKRRVPYHIDQGKLVPK
jgi:WD40 repeat protein/serine/threonine protein kinase